MSIRSIPKILEPVGGRVTRITLPTKYRSQFHQYLIKRKLASDPPYRTEVWNKIESAYTVFDLSVPYEVADLIFDDWLDEYSSPTTDL